MKVFLTGGTGFIGAHLLNHLLKEGKQVHALVRTIKKAEALPKKGVKLFKGDILDPKCIKEAMLGCEEIYHLAGNASIYEKDPSRYYSINVDGTRNVMDVAIKLGIRRMVYTSTAGVLGPSYGEGVTENTQNVIGYFNDYEKSKASAYDLIKKYHVNGEIDVITVSPTRVYGNFLFGTPTSFSFLISEYIKGKWWITPGDGTKIGNYVFIDDVVQGISLAFKKGISGKTYIIGGENHNYNNFFKILNEEAGLDYKLFKAPIWAQMLYARFNTFSSLLIGKKPNISTKWVRKGNYDWEVDSSKSVLELGVSITPLREGIRKTIARIS